MHNGLVFESIVDLKKSKRRADDAISDSKNTPIIGFDPTYAIVNAHRSAKAAAIKSIENEMKKQKDVEDAEKNISVATNFIKEGRYAEPKSGYLIVGVSIFMP